MQIERTLFKISISETIILTIFLLVALNAVIFLFSVAIGEPDFLITSSGWISQIIFPIGFSIMLSFINRNGVLKLTEFNDLTTLTKQIEYLVLKKGYVAIDSKVEYAKYVKKTKWARFFNYFFREDVTVIFSENGVDIFAKRNLLDSLRMNIKFNKTNWNSPSSVV